MKYKLLIHNFLCSSLLCASDISLSTLSTSSNNDSTQEFNFDCLEKFRPQSTQKEKEASSKDHIIEWLKNNQQHLTANQLTVPYQTNSLHVHNNSDTANDNSVQNMKQQIMQETTFQEDLQTITTIKDSEQIVIHDMITQKATFETIMATMTQAWIKKRSAKVDTFSDPNTQEALLQIINSEGIEMYSNNLRTFLSSIDSFK